MAECKTDVIVRTLLLLNGHETKADLLCTDTIYATGEYCQAPNGGINYYKTKLLLRGHSRESDS